MIEKVTFGAGCFWGIEAAFKKVKGIISTQVGYSGWTLKNPTYKDVGTNTTGHAEVVQIEFDPNQVSYKDLLEKFWQIHDPTTLNRQGPDIGTQYRSIIFFHSEEQEKLAKESKENLAKSGKYKNTIVTEIILAKEFYRAEEYHQNYYEKNGLGSCNTIKFPNL